MKFVSLANAKGLKVNGQVYTLDSDGKYGVGKLVLRTEGPTGTTCLFEVPQYFNPEAPMVKAVTVTNITHVAVMRDKQVGEVAEVVK
jgi:hypothetical protein